MPKKTRMVILLLFMIELRCQVDHPWSSAYSVTGKIDFPRQSPPKMASFRAEAQSIISIQDEDQDYWACLEPDVQGPEDPVTISTFEEIGPGSDLVDLGSTSIPRGNWHHVRLTKTTLRIRIDEITPMDTLPPPLDNEPNCRQGRMSHRTGRLCCFTCDSLEICTNMKSSISYLCGSCGENKVMESR